MNDINLNVLIEFGEDIWIANGPPVSFFGMPYSVRMSVVRLENGDLFVHSPIQPQPGLLAQLDLLGPVKYIVSPNKIHHLFMGHWQEIYPQAKLFASPGLAKKRPELEFFAELTHEPDALWAREIEQTIFAGSWAMQEVVFFHHQSNTLILTDLIENFERDWFSGWRKWMAKIVGILEPDGRAPLDFRLSFIWRKHQAKQSLQQMRNWHPKNIIIAHGNCYKGNGEAELARAFRWV